MKNNLIDEDKYMGILINIDKIRISSQFHIHEKNYGLANLELNKIPDLLDCLRYKISSGSILKDDVKITRVDGD